MSFGGIAMKVGDRNVLNMSQEQERPSLSSKQNLMRSSLAVRLSSHHVNKASIDDSNSMIFNQLGQNTSPNKRREESLNASGEYKKVSDEMAEILLTGSNDKVISPIQETKHENDESPKCHQSFDKNPYEELEELRIELEEAQNNSKSKSNSKENINNI